MIQVTQATFETYDGLILKIDFKGLIFRCPMWKVKENLLDSVCKADDSDPIVKLVKLKYKEYGKEN